MLHAIYFALLTNLCAMTCAFRFTILAEYLLNTHQLLKNDLEIYIKGEEKRLSILKYYLNIFEREHEKSMEDVPSYVGNPINGFTLLKRLSSDVNYIKTHIRNGSESVRNFTRHHNAKYPSQNDLTRAAEVIAELHYKSALDVKQLGEENLTNITYSSLMTAGDCYELGRNLIITKKDFVNGIAWMFEALRKYNEESLTFSHPFKPIRIYEGISHGYYELGDLKSALHWLRKILDLNPNNCEAKRKVQDYQKIIDRETTTYEDICFNVKELNRDDGSTHKSCNFTCSGRALRNIHQCTLRGFSEESKNFSRPTT